MITAIGHGFWQPDQLDLVTAFEPRWFAAAESAAARGPAVATAIARHAFPARTAHADFAAAGQGWLDQTEAEPALRRGVADQLDDLRRAVNVRKH